MQVTNEVVIGPLTPERWSDFEKLFGPGGAYGGCWCMWPRLRSKDWNASRAAGRKQAMRAIVAAGKPPGLLAYVGSEPVGWVSVDGRERLDRFEHSRKVKALDRPEGMWSIVCFVIAKQYRGQGIMPLLLEGALAYARERGARVIEAYPIEPQGELKSYQGFEGIASVFRKAGFMRVGGTETRPVMRKTLQ